jgi:hypothetical protein
MKTLLLALPLSVLFLGCIEEVPSHSTGGSTSAGSSVAGPEFLSLGSDVSSITENESIVVSAVLTDADGIDDLIGGTLKSPDGSITYGAFSSAAQEGAYQITVSWDQFDKIESLEFIGQTSREVMAEFYDVGGHSVAQTLTITFQCKTGAKAGQCYGFSDECTDDSCDDYCLKRGMECVDFCSIGNKTGVVWEAFSNKNACKAGTNPISSGESCATPNSDATMRCCCSPL